MCMSIGFKINARRSHPTICLQIKMQVIFEMPKSPLLAKLVRRHTAVLLPEPAQITLRPEFQNILKQNLGTFFIFMLCPSAGPKYLNRSQFWKSEDIAQFAKLCLPCCLSKGPKHICARTIAAHSTRMTSPYPFSS